MDMTVKGTDGLDKFTVSNATIIPRLGESVRLPYTNKAAKVVGVTYHYEAHHVEVLVEDD